MGKGESTKQTKTLCWNKTKLCRAHAFQNQIFHVLWVAENNWTCDAFLVSVYLKRPEKNHLCFQRSREHLKIGHGITHGMSASIFIWLKMFFITWLLENWSFLFMFMLHRCVFFHVVKIRCFHLSQVTSFCLFPTSLISGMLATKKIFRSRYLQFAFF